MRILFNNPPKDLFFKLKKIGLVDFYIKEDERTHNLKGKPLYLLVSYGLSEKACWGIITDQLISSEINIKNNYDDESKSWKCATIELSNKGLEILKNSSIKNWEIV